MTHELLRSIARIMLPTQPSPGRPRNRGKMAAWLLRTMSGAAQATAHVQFAPFILAFAFVALLTLLSLCQANEASTVDAGEAIFRYGVLSSGQLLEGSRDAGSAIRGRAAACINCHRRSGLGSLEGRISIPPITGRYLFHPIGQTSEDLDLPYVDGIHTERAPYTDLTLTKAIREGRNAADEPLGYLMPHYNNLNDSDMAALIGYLKRLDQRRQPGVTNAILHFATIITPDADRVKRRGVIDVLEHYFADKNASSFGVTPPLRSSRKMMFMVNRRWQLHVWELSGPATTWEQQLQRYFAAEPVLAVVSGVGGKTWAPVHAFCEHQAVPCLFPNVETPVVAADNYYSLYFSKGINLEAELMAKNLLDAGSGTVAKSVRQIYRVGDSGEVGAKALAAALSHHGIAVSNRALAAGEGVTRAFDRSTRADVLILWLRPPDIAALGSTPAPVAPAFVLMSGLMGGLESAPLPSNWRGVTHLTYPVDLPEHRRLRVDYALGWFAIRHIPVVAMQAQADTFLACGVLAETLSHMADTFVPDYLVERIEDMLDRRILTGYYPRLTLASGQRFASKGGYIVRFAESAGVRIVAEGDWVVP